MKSQPIYFIGRICDRLGNPFDDPTIYAYYNVFDLALQARINNFARYINIDLTIIQNVILIGISDP